MQASRLCPRILLALVLLFGFDFDGLIAQQVTIHPIVHDSLYGLPGMDPLKALRRPKVGLVLSGGGARGMSQIGVLKALERHQIPIDMIAATSLGAVVGGLYASGYSPAEIESIAVTTNWDDVLSLTEETRRTELFIDQKRAEDRSFLVLRFDGLQPVLPPAVSSGQRFTNLISTLTLQALYHPDPDFGALRIPFRAVSTDLISGKRVVMGSGSMAEALRASATVPLLFHPVERDGMQLIDGGLLSNIPVDVVRNAGCDVVIVVNSTSDLRNKDELSAPWQTADQIMGIMMQLPNRIQLEEADIVITPDIGRHLSSDFSNLDSLIHLGEIAGEGAMKAVIELVEKHYPSLHDDTVIIGTQSITLESETVPDSLLDVSPTITTIGDVRKRLRAIYRHGDYESVYSVVSHDSLSTSVIVVAKENPHVSSFIVNGANAIPPDEVREQMFSLYGLPFNYSRAASVMEDLLRLYRKRGYSLARVDSLSFDAHTGDVRVVINEGIISNVEVRGLSRTNEFFVLREFPLHQGSLFEIQKARDGITNINSTALFEYVFLEVSHSSPRPSLTIRVKERPSQLVRFGLRADNERGLGGLVDIRDQNIGGAGLEIGTAFSGGSRNKEVAVEFKANQIFNTYLTFNVGGFHSNYDTYIYGDASLPDPDRFERSRLGEYREIRTGARIVFGTQLERFGNATAELALQDVRIRNLENFESLEQRYQLSMARIGTVIDSKNDYPFPTDGFGMNLFYEFAFKEFGGDVPYSAIRFSWEAFTTWDTRHTIHPKIVLGFGDKTMPLSEQFRLGGINSFFGTDEDDRRGRQLFLFSFEYRYRLPFRIVFDSYMSIRYDAASVSLEPEEIKFRNLRHGLGVQIGLDTPIGIAAFAVGKSFFFARNLPENPVREGPFLFYFIVGYQL